MRLRFIKIAYFRDRECWYNYDSFFDFYTRFICNYLSREVRKIKDVDGVNVKCITIRCEADIEGYNPYDYFEEDNLIQTYVAMDVEKYYMIRGTGDCSFYLDLIREGLFKVRDFIPTLLEPILQIIDKFQGGGCVNTWTFKTGTFKSYDLRLRITADFRTCELTLVAHFIKISTKEELCSGIIFRSFPSEKYCSRILGDIVSMNGMLLMYPYYNWLNKPLIYLNIKEIMGGEFNLYFNVGPDSHPDQKVKVETYHELYYVLGPNKLEIGAVAGRKMMAEGGKPWLISNKDLLKLSQEGHQE